LSLPDRISSEIAAGRLAQQSGNPGRARVCARRAAGLGIKAWYQQRGRPAWHGDALRQLRRLQSEPAVPAEVRAAAARLTTKVDFDHQLPFDNDPLADAELILTYVRPAG